MIFWVEINGNNIINLLLIFIIIYVNEIVGCWLIKVENIYNW